MILNPLKSHPSIKMDDLSVNLNNGWAYQTIPNYIKYDKEYWEKYIKYEENEVCNPLNDFRCSIAEKYCSNVLDVGIGSGSFIKKLKIQKKGFDVNKYAVEWLKNNNLYHDPYTEENRFDGYCFWDVLEHFENPNDILCKVQKNAFVITSIPIFNDITKVHLSKHYRPNEHLCYFTTNGIVKFFSDLFYDCIEIRSDEIKIGRQDIMTFVFRKN
jgi:hypothetical protein